MKLFWGLVLFFIGIYSSILQANDYLDYGLYWFEADNRSIKALIDDGTENDVSINFYDPHQKTMILFHGWQLGSSIDNYRRESFYFDQANTQLAQIWK